MAFKLTENQSIAVNDKGGTLLVAAAAGSGKTAILTRRLIERLCDPECDADISEYLVVTFTKAATSELRERLYKALSEYAKNNPANARARRQLSLMGLAKISTIHSFCLDIVRSNFEALSLPSKLRMGEETEINVLLRSTLEAIVSEKYESSKDGDLFLKSVEILSSAKSDENFITAIISLYNKLRGVSEHEKKFSMYVDRYSEVEKADEIFDTYFGKLMVSDLKFELGRVISEFNCILSELSADEVLYPTLGDAIDKDVASLQDIYSALESSYENAKALALSYSASRSKSIKDYDDMEYVEEIKDQRAKCNAKIKAILKRYLGADSEIVKLAAKESRLVLLELKSTIDELDRRFSEKKLEKGLLDYFDLEQYALKLLVEDTGEFSGSFKRTALAENISKNYREIYVDEYQDTNMVQDMIFRAVSTYDADKNTESNRFLVGDVKQSIYRFRGAQPEIFSSYIKDFKDVREDTEKHSTTHKIYLSNNFRCSENVINTVNQVFDKIMSDYTENDRLIYSKIEDNKVDAPCELVLINSVEAQNIDVTSDEKLSDEATYIAMRIKEMAYNPEFLREDGEMYKYSDFAVLARSANSLSHEYRRAFKQADVPFASDTPEDFFTLPEVLLVMCLLNCVDNPQRDIYTAGLMYSPLFCFTADELCEIRKCGRKMSFYSCTEKYALENSGTELSIKVNSFLEQIGRYRALSRGTPTDILIGIMFDETGIADIYSGKQTQKRKNVMKIYELARTFEKTSFRGLSAFLDYLSDLASGNSDNREESDADSVKFMSIHRSKGLEFPVVFLSGALREFNFSDEKEPIIFSGKYGIGIKLRDTKDSEISKSKRNFSAINTPFREAIRSLERTDLLEEEKRLLYVAMTRARDRLIITAQTKNAQRTLTKAAIKRRGGFEAYGKYSVCYFDFIYHALSDKQFGDLLKDAPKEKKGASLICRKVDFSSFDIYNKSKNIKTEKNTEKLDDEKIKQYSVLIQKAKSVPEYSSALSKISAKISVSQLKKGLLDEEENEEMKVQIKNLPSFMLEDKSADGAEKGTAAHIFMQFADYESLEKNGAEYEADRLLSLGFITQRMRSIVDLDMLSAFTKSELYKEIKSSRRQYRERRFNLRLPAAEFSESTDKDFGDAFILVQGVSDLYFENPDDTITLVDFKTDRVKAENGESILKERHTTQLGYYKRAIEEITGKDVSRVYIYSFALGREILLDI